MPSAFPETWRNLKMDPQTIQTLVTVGSFLVLGTVYVVNGRAAAKILGTRLEMIDGTMEDFKLEIKKLTQVIIEQALQGARLQTLDERTLAQGQRVDDMAKTLRDMLVERRV
jgi:hypothetical protein